LPLEVQDAIRSSARESSGLNHSGTTTSTRLGWDGPSYRQLGQVGLWVPIVSSFPRKIVWIGRSS
jgi:hypothetical protein